MSSAATHAANRGAPSASIASRRVAKRDAPRRLESGLTPDELIPPPRELVLRNGTPDTIAGWKALADMHPADASLRHIFDNARHYASNPCVLRQRQPMATSSE
jgi:hypothetical protein